MKTCTQVHQETFPVGPYGLFSLLHTPGANRGGWRDTIAGIGAWPANGIGGT